MVRTSENLATFAEAFAKAQGELKNPPKNKVNPHFNSRYVDLSDGLDVIRKIFSAHGLAILQGTIIRDEITILTTRVIHKTGQWMEWEYPISGLDTHQKMGSAMTYARRYSLFGIVGVAGEDDDDGNTAAAPARSTRKPPAAPAMSAEDSGIAAETMVEQINMLHTVEEMTAWAASNKARKDQLLPAHQKDVMEAFKARKEIIS